MKLNIKEDFDKQDNKGKWLMSWTSHPTGCSYAQHTSLSGLRWRNLKARTKEGGSYQEKFPTYIGSECNFQNFQDFVCWSRREVGYDTKEYNGKVWSLDKDILSGGGKVYSENTCMFVPNSVNCFLRLPNKKDGLPIGVIFDEDRQKYRVRVSRVDPFKQAFSRNKERTILWTNDMEEGHHAWKIAKREELLILLEYGKSLGHMKLVRGLSNIRDKLDDSIRKADNLTSYW